MKPTIFLILIWLFFSGCAPDHGEEAEATYPVTLLCEAIADSENEARFAVTSRVKEQKMRIGHLPACRIIRRKDLPRYGIPQKALAAVGDSTDGRGSFYYAVRSEEGVVFYYGRPNDSHRLVARHRDGQFELKISTQ